MLSTFISSLTIVFSLGTASGILLHETRLDKAAGVAMALPATLASYEGQAKLIHVGDFHTHAERGSVAQAGHAFHSGTPGLKPRRLEDNSPLLAQKVPRGHHAFDSYYLPIV